MCNVDGGVMVDVAVDVKGRVKVDVDGDRATPDPQSSISRSKIPDHRK